MDDQDQLANANPHWTGVSDEIYIYIYILSPQSILQS